MRPVSDAFLRAVRGSHTMIARATVCSTFQTGTTPTGTRVPIFSGDVVVDGTADIRSTLDMTTDGTGLWPTRADSLFAPYGNEIYVERGIALADDQLVYVGLGYFRIQGPEQDGPPNGPIRISGQDRMAGIIEARLLEPRQFDAGASLGFVMSTLVEEVYPAATIEWDDDTDTAVLARPMIAEEDRFAFLKDLVEAQGKVWYWDHRGVLVIKSVPDPGDPVFDVSAGENGVLVSLSRSLSREGVYNAVVAVGEATDTQTPVRGVAVDNNPNSPTYYFGRFGPVPRFYSSSFLTSDAQAFSAAYAMLKKSLGLPYSVDFTAIPNPALEPWDPVTIRPSSGEAVETHIIESLTIPLDNNALSAKTREQTVILVGTP